MKKRILLGFVCAVILFIIVISIDTKGDYGDITCYSNYLYYSASGGIPEFDPGPESERPALGKNIFFHETSCFGEDGLNLNARQACAVESAARMNPSMTVYLLFVSPARVSNASGDIVKQLLSYENVKIRHIYPDKYVRNTPLETWYANGALKKSRWPRSHLSDVLRYLTLWKYGGIYLDLDVIVVRSLEGLTNFAGAEDWDDVAAGVMGFTATSLGRRVADMCLRDLKSNFRGDIWGNNGPGVITRTLHKLCSTEYTQDMTTARCHGFKVFPPSAFYPIHYKKWRRYFEAKESNATMKILEKAMVVHVWNQLSKQEDVRVDSDVPYAILARKYCPKVFSNCGKVF